MTNEPFLLIVFLLSSIHPSEHFNFIQKPILHSTFETFKNQIAYFRKDEANLTEALRICRNSGGLLPSVHSAQDVMKLTKMLGQIGHKSMWLGAEPRTNASSSGFVDKWIDGSPFNHTEWSKSYPSCNSSCCGMAIGHGQLYEPGKMFYSPCDQSKSVLCIFSLLSQSRKMAKEMDISKELSSNVLLRDELVKLMEEKLAIDMFNKSLRAMFLDPELVSAMSSQMQRMEKDLANMTAQYNSNVEFLSKQMDTTHSHFIGTRLLTNCIIAHYILILFLVTYYAVWSFGVSVFKRAREKKKIIDQGYITAMSSEEVSPKYSSHQQQVVK